MVKVNSKLLPPSWIAEVTVWALVLLSCFQVWRQSNYRQYRFTHTHTHVFIKIFIFHIVLHIISQGLFSGTVGSGIRCWKCKTSILHYTVSQQRCSKSWRCSPCRGLKTSCSSSLSEEHCLSQTHSTAEKIKPSWVQFLFSAQLSSFILNISF